MRTLRPHWLVAAALLYVSVIAAHAQAIVVEREVTAAAGRDVRVRVYINIRPDCTSGPLPAIRLANPPAHGAVTVKRGTLRATNLKQCLATEAPVLVAIYRAAGEYIGTDQFILEITSSDGRKQLQQFRVNVTNSPGGGQGI
jgi:hypothetical protein